MKKLFSPFPFEFYDLIPACTFAYVLFTGGVSHSAERFWEQNQKSYNEVWLEMVADDQEAPDSVQLDLLMSVAKQCPFAGGEAVYQARALLSEDLVYDDSILCNSGSQQLVRKNSETDLSFTAYPNPGKDYVIVELDQEASGKGILSLTNTLGSVVRSQVIADGDQMIFFMLDQVPAGLYYLTVEIGGQKETHLLTIFK